MRLLSSGFIVAKLRRLQAVLHGLAMKPMNEQVRGRFEKGGDFDQNGVKPWGKPMRGALAA
jgi:hypothetical protein